MKDKRICICGAGTMGSGIAQSAAQSGLSGILFDLNETVLDNARKNISDNLLSLVEKNKISAAQKETIFQSILFTSDVNHCIADIFIEAIVEKAEVKIDLFNQLAGLNNSSCIFASNTSSLSVTSIAKEIINPERVIGMHFFNPATIMKLVEVINTQYTSPSTTQIIIDLAKAMGKTPVLCKDSPGFIVNRVARPYYIESLRLAEEKLVSFDRIDALLESAGFKMGPFKLMDLIGNDVNYAVSNSVYGQLLQPERLKPSYLQQEKVEAGELGRKTGKGYYEYKSPAKK